MGYQQQYGSFSSVLLYQIYQACMAKGARKPSLLAAADITEAQLRDPQGRIDQLSAAQLLSAGLKETQDSEMMFKLGRRMLPVDFSDDQYPLLFASSLKEVIRETVLWLNGQIGADFLRLENAGQNRSLLRVSGNAHWPALIELVFSQIYYLASSLTAAHFPAVKAIYFTHTPLADIGSIHSSLPVPCICNHAFNAIEFQDHWLELPNPQANPAVISAAKEQMATLRQLEARGKQMTSIVYFYLRPLLSKSGQSLGGAAESLEIAERTLRRKLVAEGTSFRSVTEMLRRDICQLYFLEGTRQLTEIATKLGYSELSAFTRAYSAWFGHPPSHDRIELRPRAA